MWPVVIGASVIVGLLAGGLVGLNRRRTELPPAPTGVRATARTCSPQDCDRIESSVTLSWNATRDGSITGLSVVRDGARLPAGSNLPPATTAFVDDTVVAGTRHDYALVAIGRDGESPGSDPAEVQVPFPPLHAAQLRGIYDVALVVRRAANIRSLSGIPSPKPGEGRGTTWGFQPLCDPDQGACPAGWIGRSGLLRPAGITWSGTLFGPEARCPDGSREPSRIHMRLHVRDAEMLASAWTVVNFEGAYSVTFHCRGFLPSEGILHVTGRHR